MPVQLGLTAATLIGVVAIVRVAQGQSLDSTAADVKRGVNNAAVRAKQTVKESQGKL